MSVATMAEIDHTCKSRTHSPTNTAWQKGCRHPGALEAHERWLELCRVRREMAKAAGTPGTCGADRHGSVYAYETLGCRCPESRHAYLLAERKRVYNKARKRNLEALANSYRRDMYASRVTGGRLRQDPRQPWRYGKMAVGRCNLILLLSGFSDAPTMAERMVAVIRLARVRVPNGVELSRTLDYEEIAIRLGISEASVGRLKNRRRDLRALRTERRLADNRWRVALTARGAERRPRP